MKLYTLTCSSCGNSYYSKEAFPKHQYCKTCSLAFRAGVNEVVEWIERLEAIGHISHLGFDLAWQSKLKEWEVTHG